MAVGRALLLMLDVGDASRMEIECVDCGSENLIRDPDAPRQGRSGSTRAGEAEIPLRCEDCGWRGSRTPQTSCSRCGYGNIDASPVDGWAYADLEEARDDPASAEWGYVDKTAHRCRKCHHEWTTAGAYRPYAPEADAAVTAFRDDDAG